MGSSRSSMNGNYIPQMKGGNFGDIFNMPPAAIMGKHHILIEFVRQLIKLSIINIEIALRMFGMI